MINDVQAPFPAIGVCHSHFLKLSKITLDRERGQQWARNLRFLVYAGSNPGQRPDQVYNGSIRLTTDTDYSFPAECNQCKNLPWFPRGVIPIRDLRLTKPGEIYNCSDYFAISYCWREHSSLESDDRDPYHIQMKKKKWRRNIAPREILDRAIYVARHAGIRMIWIDQECIDQKDRTDKEFGIQSMDKVFERAISVGGPLSLKMNTRAEWDALKILQDFNNELDDRFHNEPLVELLRHLSESGALGVLERILQDRWFQRSWIFQEMACANVALHLSIRSHPDLITDVSDPFEPKEIGITLIHLRGWFWTIIYGLLAPKESDGSFDPDLIPFRDRLLTVCVKFQYQIPLLNEANDELAGKRRNLCNAVEAIYYLSSRQNSKIADRLAIIANLCNYSIRIDTRKAEKKDFSLCTCIFVLALLNGDLSLMVGMAREIWHPKRTLQREKQCFSWIPLPSARLTNTNWSFENSCTSRAIGVKITRDGLSLPGFLWTVNKKLNLYQVQRRYCDDPSPFLDHLQHKRANVAYENIYMDIFKELHKQKQFALAAAIWKFLRREKDPEDYSKDRRPVTESFKDFEDEENRKLFFHFGELPRLNAFLNLNSIVTYVHEKKIREIRGDSVEESKRFLRREWLARKVVKDGYLWCGSLGNPVVEPPEFCAVFDVDEEATVLTPYCTGQNGVDKTDKIRYERMSWVVSRERGSLISNDMVRGMWDTAEISPKTYVLT